MKILGEHNVFDGGKVRHEVVLLEDEAQLLRPEARPLRRRKLREVTTVDDHSPLGGSIEAAEDIQQGALAGPRGSHHCDPLALLHRERSAVKSVDRPLIFLRQSFDFN